MLNVKKLLTNIIQELKTPSFGFSSTGSGTKGSNYSNASGGCQLYRLGNIVFCSFRIAYTSGSSTFAADDTLYTIPANFRPSGNVTGAATIIRGDSMWPFGGFVKIDSSGKMSHSHGTGITSLDGFLTWEIQGGGN